MNCDRGLLFLSYQASIENQFEFLSKNWMNRSDKPTNAPSPNNYDSGYDMLIGQNGSGGRKRFGTFQINRNSNVIEGQVKTDGLNILDWVIPTGGGYFFSPSIKSLKSFFVEH
jgi:deferrochelatase/peroxidase EfeB